MEADHEYYHETFDPLLYLIFFLLVRNLIYFEFIKKLTNKKFILLITFSISFYLLSIAKTIYSPIEMPNYSLLDWSFLNNLRGLPWSFEERSISSRVN